MEHLQKTTSAIFYQIKIKGFELKYHFNFLWTVRREPPLFLIHVPVSILILESLRNDNGNADGNSTLPNLP